MSSCSVAQYRVHLAHWSIEVRPWYASCRWSRVPDLVPQGMTTLFPVMKSPSEIVNSARNHQYGCRCSGKSCMLSGQPVMMRSVNVAKVESTFVSSCSDRSRVDSTFRTCPMLMSRPCISLALPCLMRWESVEKQRTLGSNVPHLNALFSVTQQHSLLELVSYS